MQSQRLDRALKFDSFELKKKNIYSKHTHAQSRFFTANTKAGFWGGSERKSKGCVPPAEKKWVIIAEEDVTVRIYSTSFASVVFLLEPRWE